MVEPQATACNASMALTRARHRSERLSPDPAVNGTSHITTATHRPSAAGILSLADFRSQVRVKTSKNEYRLRCQARQGDIGGSIPSARHRRTGFCDILWRMIGWGRHPLAVTRHSLQAAGEQGSRRTMSHAQSEKNRVSRRQDPRIAAHTRSMVRLLPRATWKHSRLMLTADWPCLLPIQ